MFNLTIPALALAGAAAMGWLESLSGLRHFQRCFEVGRAVLLILTGLYLLNAYVMVVTQLAY